jgi:hypothetical protein
MTPTTLQRTDPLSTFSCDGAAPASACARIRAEFVEMPGLTLTLPQATRLWGLSAAQSQRLLSDLVAAGFLMVDSRGSYRRHNCPRCC